MGGDMCVCAGMGGRGGGTGLRQSQIVNINPGKRIQDNATAAREGRRRVGSQQGERGRNGEKERGKERVCERQSVCVWREREGVCVREGGLVRYLRHA